jgi:hypothetical protein
MLIKGKTISLAEEILVLPRIGGDLVFKARAVRSFEEFETMVTEPKPKMMVKAGETEAQPMVDDAYKQKKASYGRLRLVWMIIKSLSATEGLVLETVNMDDPSTWENFWVELTSTGLSFVEQEMLVNLAQSANSMNQDKIEEARKRFLAGQGKA